MLLEVACFNLKDALLAAKSGADRIEFCEDYDLGGVTPTQKEIRAARKKIKIPLFVMIRPRGGNFIYTKKELSEMRKQIAFCKKEKCDGVVFGILNEKLKIDKKSCRQLVKLAAPMSCTFHRAFDDCKNKDKAVKTIIDCGFTRILTSGGEGGVRQNTAELKRLIKKYDHKIVIMPGGGVRSNNIYSIVKKVKCSEIHTAAVNAKTKKLNAAELKRVKRKLDK